MRILTHVIGGFLVVIVLLVFGGKPDTPDLGAWFLVCWFLGSIACAAADAFLGVTYDD